MSKQHHPRLLAHLPRHLFFTGKGRDPALAERLTILDVSEVFAQTLTRQAPANAFPISYGAER